MNIELNLSAFRVALVQFEAIENSIDKILFQIEKHINKAAKENADFVLFPECTLTGYNLHGNNSIKFEDKNIKKLVTLSKKYSISFSVGFIENLRNKNYISQICISPNLPLSIYRKTHLGNIEKNTFTSGYELPVFKILDSNGNYVNIAFAICYDTHFPEVFSIYAVKKADIVFCPFYMMGNTKDASKTFTASAEKRVEAWSKYLGTRCFDNTIYATAVNQFKFNNDLFSGGGEAAWSYTSEIKKSVEKDHNNHITYYDFNITKLRNIRNHNNKKYFLKNRQNSLYLKELTNLIK